MHRNLIAMLRCPYTGSRFDLTVVGEERDSNIEFGVVTSEAGQFPVIAGVLRLLPDRLQDSLVDLVKHGRHDTALMTALEVPFQAKRDAMAERLIRAAGFGDPRRSRGFALPSKRRLYRLVTQRNVTFSKLASDSGADGWSQWQTYRFSMPTFLPVYPLAHLAKGCGMILDFGCGLGHSSFLMQRLAGENATVICADYSFTSLYLASRFLVPDSPCICLDGDYPMPFQNGAMDLVFSTDAMQYIEPKVGLVREFRRILKPDGVVALAHLHNRLSSARTGKSLTPIGYDGLFEGMCRQLYPEDDIVADYVTDQMLDLRKAYRTEDLQQATGGVSLVAANTQAPFVEHKRLCDEYMDAMRHPHVNPAYRTQRSNDALTLDRGVGAPYAIERTVRDLELLPKTWRVSVPSLGRKDILALRTHDRLTLRELIRRFLVLDLPEAFFA